MAKTPKQIKTIKDLVPDPQNVNKGTQRGLSALDHSARKFGVGRGVVVDKNGVIIAGNKTVERLADLGITKIKPVHTSGDELVVTVRDDLDLLSKKDRRARGLALADNRVGQLDYDEDTEALAALAMDERELLEGLWNDSEINEILGAEAGTRDVEPQVNKASELAGKWNTSLGQIWSLGDHRLLCGDSRDAIAVSRMIGDSRIRLTWTDPPYGVGYQTKLSTEEAVARHRRRDGAEVENDSMSESETEQMIVDALSIGAEHSETGGGCLRSVPGGDATAIFHIGSGAVWIFFQAYACMGEGYFCHGPR